MTNDAAVHIKWECEVEVTAVGVLCQQVTLWPVIRYSVEALKRQVAL